MNDLNRRMNVNVRDLNSYRLIYNLPFMSKVLEKAVSNSSNFSIVFQFAYKQLHSTETAPQKVHNNISLNVATGKVTALTLLDLFASFDTNDYSVLLDRPSDWYAILSTVLTWTRSFLINRF